MMAINTNVIRIAGRWLDFLGCCAGAVLARAVEGVFIEYAPFIPAMRGRGGN
jgi:hypothetical protein